MVYQELNILVLKLLSLTSGKAVIPRGYYLSLSIRGLLHVNPFGT